MKNENKFIINKISRFININFYKVAWILVKFYNHSTLKQNQRFRLSLWLQETEIPSFLNPTTFNPSRSGSRNTFDSESKNWIIKLQVPIASFSFKKTNYFFFIFFLFKQFSQLKSFFLQWVEYFLEKSKKMSSAWCKLIYLPTYEYIYTYI